MVQVQQILDPIYVFYIIVKPFFRSIILSLIGNFNHWETTRLG